LYRGRQRAAADTDVAALPRVHISAHPTPPSHAPDCCCYLPAAAAGEKRARRAKLNYLFGRDYKTYLVDSSTKEASEILREKRERKEAQRQGKVYMKERTAAGVAAAGGKAAAKAASAAKAAATKGGKGKGKGGKK
jgi:hypothetical protein